MLKWLVSDSSNMDGAVASATQNRRRLQAGAAAGVWSAATRLCAAFPPASAAFGAARRLRQPVQAHSSAKHPNPIDQPQAWWRREKAGSISTGEVSREIGRASCR